MEKVATKRALIHWAYFDLGRNKRMIQRPQAIKSNKKYRFGEKSKKVEISVNLKPISGEEAYNNLDPISR